MAFHIFLTYSSISPSHDTLLANIKNQTFPQSYVQTVLDPRWQEAMITKLEAL